MGEENEFWCYPAKDIVYEKLDPGVREVVRFLVSKGFNTTDSGDGEHKTSKGWDADNGEMIPFPHVYISTPPEELVQVCRWLKTELSWAGIEVVGQTEAWMEVMGTDKKPKPYIEASYDPGDGRALIGLFHVTSDMISNKS